MPYLAFHCNRACSYLYFDIGLAPIIWTSTASLKPHLILVTRQNHY